MYTYIHEIMNYGLSTDIASVSGISYLFMYLSQSNKKIDVFLKYEVFNWYSSFVGTQGIKMSITVTAVLPVWLLMKSSHPYPLLV